MEVHGLFVYGTLLPECRHPMSEWLSQNSRVICAGQLAGELYDLGDYPGLLYLPASASRVKGLIVLLSDPEKALIHLDEYEGIGEQPGNGDEYRREIIPVMGDDGRQRICWVYVYIRDVAGLKRIISGFYPDVLRFEK